ncbi:MAG: AAA family ATPase [Proteobacteria bacterium]|nr:AAA family ATPase [Pseudomonadota bacterium]MBU1686430.1 AAA family ATPase [Pseudomonadota bacterium]
MKIAISGKGGVGKTTIMALLAELLKRAGKEVLIIDADSSPHMAQTIGITNPGGIVPIAEMKTLLVERSGKTEGSPFYNINPQVDDLLAQFMVEENGLRLMVLGSIETGDSGCACAENTVLRRMLTKMLLKPTQYVLLDMEAGVEHLGRGTIAGVDHLLTVVIPSQSSIRTALKVKKLANDVGIHSVHFVGNRIMEPDDLVFLESGLGEKTIAALPDSKAIRRAERQGQPIPSQLSAVEAEIQKILTALEGTT